MKLIDLNAVADTLSWDTGDTVYDAIVHVELDKDMFEPNAKDEYPNLTRFTKLVYQYISVNKIFNGAYAQCICNWCELFSKNIDLWKKYTKSHWSEDYHNLCSEDVDEYIFQLIDSMEKWLAGYCTEEMYDELSRIITQCK